MPAPPELSLTVRPARADDVTFLWEMLDDAANWEPSRARVDVRADPHLAHYVEGWNPSEGGVVALRDGERIGAAWLRLLPASDPGYGYWRSDVPEVTLGVAEEARGYGVGRALVRALGEHAVERGYEAISLSVEPINHRALRLYLSEGFERTGHVVGTSEVLVKHLRGRPS